MGLGIMQGVYVRVRGGFQHDLRGFFIVKVHFIQYKNFRNFTSMFVLLKKGFERFELVK